MKKSDSSRLESLEALLAEKRKQEGYLAKLEERRAGTPEHVFVRLRDEYLTKLTDAQVKAHAEAEQISGGVEEDEAAVAEIEAKLAVLEEERLEMQLRADVEEWEPKETQKKLTAMTAAISMAEKERDARRSVAERTRALLDEARGATPAIAQSAPTSPSGPVIRPTMTAMSGGPNFDELAFLNSVVGRTSTQNTPVVRDSKAVAQPDEAKDAKDAKDGAARSSAAEPLPVPPSPAPAPPPVVVPAAQSTQPLLDLETPKPAAEPPSEKRAEPVAKLAEPVEEKPVPKPAEKPADKVAEKPAAPPAEDDEPQSALGRPTPRTSQAVKTLKCAECGSFNYPTEWYCERCGGELAAL